MAASLVLAALAPASSAASPPQHEYTLSAATQCVYSPGVFNETGEGEVTLHAKAPETLVPTAELELKEAAATIELPASLTRFLRVLGASHIEGEVTQLPLALTLLEPQALNAAAPEGDPSGLEFGAALPAEGQATLTIPASGTIALGPLYTAGAAAQTTDIALSTQAAYEATSDEETRYRATGKGLVVSLAATGSGGGRTIGYNPVVCTQKEASAQIPVKAPPAGAEAPRNTAAPAIAGEAKEGETLAASEGTWSGSAPLSYAWRWERCGADGCGFIEGARSATYTLTHADVGETIRAIAAASNEAGTTKATTPASATVVAYPPHNTVAPAITGEARAGEPLSVSLGTWEGAPTLSYAYRWERCEAETCKPIAGATTSSYAPTRADVGKTLRVAVSAQNPAGTVTESTQETAAVASFELSAGEKEYALAAKAQCVVAPEIFNESGEGHVTVEAIGPQALAPGEESTLRDASAEITLPQGFVRFLHGLGATEARGYLTSLPLDLERLEPATLNPATGEGQSEGRAYAAMVEGEAPVTLEVPETGSFAIGPAKVTGKAGESASVGLDTQAAYEAYGSEGGYKATGKGLVLNIQGYHEGSHDIGPIQVVCTQGSATTELSIVNRPPSDVAPPSISGTPLPGQTLKVEPGRWGGTAPVSFPSYEWERCDTYGENCSPITGATTSTYSLTTEDVGHTFRAKVTARNEFGEASAATASASYIVIAPTTTYYVCSLCTNASDSNSGTSPAFPWASFKRVQEQQLGPGDAVLFHGGETFTAPGPRPEFVLPFSSSGTEGKPIVYGSYEDGPATFQGELWLPEEEGWITIQNLIIEGSGAKRTSTDGIASSGHGNDSHVSVLDDAISDTSTAIQGAAPTEPKGAFATDNHWLIGGNTIRGTGESGIYAQGEYFTIEHNRILDTGLDKGETLPGSTEEVPHAHGVYLRARDSSVLSNTIAGFAFSGVSARYRNSRIEQNAISDGPIGISWYQYDQAAGTGSKWNDNRFEHLGEDAIYVSKEQAEEHQTEAGGEATLKTMESFEIHGNVGVIDQAEIQLVEETLGEASADLEPSGNMELGPTTGTYRVSENLPCNVSDPTAEGEPRGYCAYQAGAPLALTEEATAVTGIGATLVGVVNNERSEASYWFEYGPTERYGTRAPVPSAVLGWSTQQEPHSVRQSISGLAAGTAYHYRLVGENPVGTFYGQDKTFTTP